jgi:hypothetical protein
MPALNSATSSRPIRRRAIGQGKREGHARQLRHRPGERLRLAVADQCQQRQPVGRPAAVMGHGPFSAALFAARWLRMVFDAARTMPGARRVECAS